MEADIVYPKFLFGLSFLESLQEQSANGPSRLLYSRALSDVSKALVLMYNFMMLVLPLLGGDDDSEIIGDKLYSEPAFEDNYGVIQFLGIFVTVWNLEDGLRL